MGFSPSYTAKISRLAKIKSRLIAWDWFGTRYVSCLCAIVDHAACLTFFFIHAWLHRIEADDMVAVVASDAEGSLVSLPLCKYEWMPREGDDEVAAAVLEEGAEQTSEELSSEVLCV